MVEREGRINLKTLPLVTEYFDQGTQTAQEALDEGGQGQGGISEELAELRERESAYKETIREADAILSKVEGGYVQKIAALETELTALRTKVREIVRTGLVIFANVLYMTLNRFSLRPVPVQSGAVGFNTGNGEKLSYSQAACLAGCARLPFWC